MWVYENCVCFLGVVYVNNFFVGMNSNLVSLLLGYIFVGCPFRSTWLGGLGGWNWFRVVCFGRGCLDWLDLGGCECGFAVV